MANVVRHLDRLLREHAWWTLPQLAGASVLGSAVGLWGLWFGLAACNTAAVWLYCDQLGRFRRRRQLVAKLLAIPLLPVGVITLFATRAGPSPGEAAGSASTHESLRTATSMSSPLIKGDVAP